MLSNAQYDPPQTHRLEISVFTAASTLIFALALSGCTGSKANQTIPTLPRDGDNNTDKPKPIIVADGATGMWSNPDDLIGPPPAMPVAPLKLPKTSQFTLKNGLEVILVSDPDAPITSYQLAVKAGRERGSLDKVGLARLSAVMMTRGTRSRNAAAIVGAIESAGGDLTADASYEATLLSCNALAAQSSTCSTILADIVTAPTFPAAAFNEVQTRFRDLANQQVRDPQGLASTHFQNELWGKGHSRGWPSSQRSIGAISRNDVVKWHRTFIRPNNAVLAISGDFAEPSTQASMKKVIEKSFGRWARGKIPALKDTPTPQTSGIRVRVVDKPDEKFAHIRIGHFGVADSDDDFFPTLVVNAVLGELPINSRLGNLLSGERNLRAESQVDRNRALGSWVIRVSPPAPEAVAVVQRVRDALMTMRNSGPTEDELRAAKSLLAGKFTTRFQSTSDVAGAVLAARLHGFTEDRVAQFPVLTDNVTLAQAVATSKRRLQPDNLVIVMVGPARTIVPQLSRAGWKHTVTSYINPVAPWERDANDADAKAILADALAAKGGKGVLTKLKSFEWTGTAQLVAEQTMDAKVEKQFVMPDQLRLEMKIPEQKATIVTVMSGDLGWAQQITPQGAQSVSFPKSEVEAGKAQIWRDQDLVLLRYLDKGADVTLVDEIDVGGVKNWAIRIISNDKKYSVVLYISQVTKLLSGMTYQERGQDGKVVVAEERYENYKKVSGLQIAHTRVTRSAQVNLTTQIKTISINKPIDSKIFIKPAK